MSNDEATKARPAGDAITKPGSATASFRGSHPGLSLEGARLLDAACDAFERAWRDGTHPDVQAAVLGLAESLRPAAVKELVALDVHYRRKAGESPVVIDYDQLPGLDLDWLAELLGEVAPHPVTAGNPPVTIVPPCVGDRIGAYELLKELGRGGMGIVFLARQHGLKRDVAVKMVTGEAVSRATLARFWAEAEVLAEVKHPNVVQVIELGEDAGRPFMAMEFVSGGSLGSRLRAGTPLPPLKAANLMVMVARGVAAAHDLGIVHRDLKPDNVLLDGDTPKVADFGIAKRKAHELTQTKAVMGTPAYMSPEQAASQSRHVGPAADVWSLGVMLYECLSGKRPFTGESVFDVLAKIANEEPSPLRTWLGTVPRDLETIVAKCMTKEPELRYATAKELADDLGRFVRGEPIEARPVGAAERMTRWVRRKPAAAAAYGFSSVAVLLALVVFVVFGFWREAEGAKGQLETANGQLTTEKKQTEEARDEAFQQKTKADKSRDDAFQQKLAADKARGEAERLEGIAKKAQANEAAHRQQVEREREKLAVFEYGRTMQVAHQEWRENNVATARTLLDSTDPKLRGNWEWRYLNRICDSSLLTFRGHVDGVSSASFSGDGSRIVTGSWDRTAKVWDAKTGDALLTLKGHTNSVSSASFIADGSRIVTASWDRTAKVWDAKTGDALLTLKGHTGWLSSASFSGDGSRIVTGSWDKTARVWDTKTGAELLTLKGHANQVSFASFSGDGSRIVTGSWDRTAKVWDAKTGDEVLTLKGHTGMVSASFSGDGSRIVTSSQDQTAKVWDAKTGDALLTLRGHTGGVHSASFSVDGSRIVTGSGDRTAKVWDAKTGAEVLTLRGHTDRVYSVSFSGDGSRIVTGSGDRTAKVWDAKTGDELLLLTLRGHTGGMSSASFSGDGSRIVTGSGNQTAKVWDTKTGAALLTFRGHADGVSSVSFGADGSRVVTGSQDQTAKVWEVPSTRLEEFAKTRVELLTLRGHTGGVYSASFSVDGSRIVTGSGDQTAKVWDAKTGAEALTLRGHTGGVRSASFSVDGSRIVTCGWDRTAKVWDAKTGGALLTLKGHTGDVYSASFNSDGTRIVTAGWDETVVVWDAKTGKELLTLRGHTHGVSSAVFSPDGTRIVTGSWDKTARVWDTKTGAELLTLKGHADGVSSVSFSPDGSRIVTASADDTARVWDSRPFRDTQPHNHELAPAPREVNR